MDYTKILTRSFEVVWKNRALWVFGILLALFGGSGGSSFQFPGAPSDDVGRGTTPTLPNFNFEALIPLFIAIGCIIVILGILGLILRFVSRGALIGLVQELEQNQTTPTVRRGFSIGSARFWSLLGIAFLINLPLALCAILLLAFAAFPFLAALFTRPRFQPDEILAAGGIGSLVLLVCVILFLVLVALALKPIYEFIMRACVVEKSGAMDSIREGIRLVRANLGSVVVLYILAIAVGIGYGIAMIPITLVLIAIPLAIGYAIYFVANAATTAIIAGFIIALPFILFLLFLSGLYLAFESTLWTEGYLQVAKR